MTASRPQLRSTDYDEFGADRLGYVSTATIAAASLTDTQRLGNGLIGTNQYRSRWVYLPGGVGTDRIKPMGTLASGGVWSHIATVNWSGLVTGSNVTYECLVRALYPDTYNAIIHDAMRLIDVPTYEVLSDVDDGSMNDPDCDGWIAGVAGMAAPVKTNDSFFNQTGFWSTYVVNAHASDYIQNAVPLAVAPYQQRYVSAHVIVQTGGPPTLTVWDETHGQALAVNAGTVVTGVSGSIPQRLATTYNVPAGCYAVSYRLGMTDAASVGGWDCVASHPISGRYFKLPSYINQNRRLIDLTVARYDEALGGLSGVSSIASQRYEGFKRGVRWEVENLGEDANPNAIQIYGTEPLPADDLWLYARRPWWDKSPLDDEVKTTEAPEDELQAARWFLLGEHMARELGEKPGTGGFWSDVAAKNRDAFNREVITAREDMVIPAAAKHYVNFGRGMGGRGFGGRW